MTEVAQAIAHHGVGKRVAAQDRPLQVRYKGDLLPDDATIARQRARARWTCSEVVYA